MPIDPKRVQAVFLAAVECREPAARAAVLDRECASDPELRRRVEALLRGYDLPDSLLDQPMVGPASHGVLSLKGPADNGLEGAGAESPIGASGGARRDDRSSARRRLHQRRRRHLEDDRSAPSPPSPAMRSWASWAAAEWASSIAPGRSA